MVSNMRTKLTLLLALAMTVAPAMSVAAQQGEEKQYETDVSEDRATIEITREFDEREATTEITFDTVKGHFETKFDYQNATTESESKLEIAFHQLVEYRDANDDGRYDADDDVASAWNVANESRDVTESSNGTLEWRPLSESDVTSDNGTEGTHIHGVAHFPTDDPVEGVLRELGQGENRTFTVDIYVFGQNATYQGTELGPMEVKIDLGVTNYPYTKNGTELALISESKAERELSVDDDVNASEVSVSQEIEDLTVDIAFAWDDQATVDGEMTTVETTVLESESESESDDGEASASSERLFAFSYERGDEIVHDPTLGASTAEDEGFIGRTSDRASDVPGLTVWTALIGVVGAAALVRHRRG